MQHFYANKNTPGLFRGWEGRDQNKEVISMELTPWKPFRELGRLRDEMDRLWEDFFGERRFFAPSERRWHPSLDVAETKDNVMVTAEIPGMDAKDIDISVLGDVLTIKGEKKQEKEEKEENYHLVERMYGAFTRSITLPGAVDTEKIEATYKKGVLRITLPKKEEAKAKEVKVKVA
jgi:HSP20 family protein